MPLSRFARIAIVAIGVGSYASMTSVYRDLDAARAQYYDNQRLAHFTLDLKRMPKSILGDLPSIPNIRELRGQHPGSVRPAGS